MRFSELKIVVTGGAGFIGSHLVDQLMRRDNHVTVIDNFATGTRKNLSAHLGSPRFALIEGDVRDRAALEEASRGADVVFHLATNCVRLSLTEPAENHEVNATGTLNALLAAKSAGVRRFVYCSSSEIYGNVQALLPSEGPREILLSEESPRLPTTIYGASKLVGEHYTLAFHQTYGLPALVVRPFNAYGPRSHFSGPYGEVIPRFAIWLRAGAPLVIFGDGQQTRDFTYVEDTAAGLISAAECDALLGDSVNIAHGEEVSIHALASLLYELHHRPFQPKYAEERPGDIRRLGADVSKAKRFLSAVAATSLREGLSRYLAWLDTQALDYPKLARELSEKNWILAPPTESA